MFERLLDLAGNRQLQRLTAGCRVRQIFVEGALDTRGPMAVDVSETNNVRGKRSLRIETVGLGRRLALPVLEPGLIDAD